jgi:tRNA threonylcarbamoyladenosine modification (KEOPS) complex Cgi121 subunit
MGVPGWKIFEMAGVKRRVIGIAGGVCKVGDVDEILTQLHKISKKHGTVAQVFDAHMVLGAGHLVHAARLATLAQESGRGFTNTLELELICWASAERQIGRAIKKMGLKPGHQELVFLVVGDSDTRVRRTLKEIFTFLKLKPAPGVLRLSREKEKKIREIFSITSRELEAAALEKLLIERISSLELQR